MRLRPVFAIIGVMALSACGSGARTTRDQALSPTPSAAGTVRSAPPVSTYFSPPPPYPGLAWQYHGRSVDPDDDFDTIGGAEHCGWQSAVVLMGPWPLGHGQPKSLRQYLRDPRHAVSRTINFTHGDRSLLPLDARPTGYSHKTLELWLADSDADRYVYMVSGNDVEQWPRVQPPQLCS